jgi:hypothetical protein
MKPIVFLCEKFPHQLHTLTASLDMDGNLVFDDDVANDAGSQADDYLLVRAEQKSRVLFCLSRAFDRISNTCGEAADDRLFCVLDRVAQSGHWKSLDQVETWLMDRGVPFVKQKWFDHK